MNVDLGYDTNSMALQHCRLAQFGCSGTPPAPECALKPVVPVFSYHRRPTALDLVDRPVNVPLEVDGGRPLVRFPLL